MHYVIDFKFTNVHLEGSIGDGISESRGVSVYYNKNTHKVFTCILIYICLCMYTREKLRQNENKKVNCRIGISRKV